MDEDIVGGGTYSDATRRFPPESRRATGLFAFMPFFTVSSVPRLLPFQNAAMSSQHLTISPLRWKPATLPYFFQLGRISTTLIFLFRACSAATESTPTAPPEMTTVVSGSRRSTNARTACGSTPLRDPTMAIRRMGCGISLLGS